MVDLAISFVGDMVLARSSVEEKPYISREVVQDAVSENLHVVDVVIEGEALCIRNVIKQATLFFEKD